MADFCKQCSEDLFGEDYGDFAGQCSEDEMVTALCEGCGMTSITRNPGHPIIDASIQRHLVPVLTPLWYWHAYRRVMMYMERGFVMEQWDFFISGSPVRFHHDDVKRWL